MSRQECNRNIIGKLSELVEAYPNYRFGQILFNYVLSYSYSELGQIHVDDPFYEESKITLDRLDKKLKKYTNNWEV